MSERLTDRARKAVDNEKTFDTRQRIVTGRLSKIVEDKEEEAYVLRRKAQEIKAKSEQTWEEAQRLRSALELIFQFRTEQDRQCGDPEEGPA